MSNIFSVSTSFFSLVVASFVSLDFFHFRSPQLQYYHNASDKVNKREEFAVLYTAREAQKLDKNFVSEK